MSNDDGIASGALFGHILGRQVREATEGMIHDEQMRTIKRNADREIGDLKSDKDRLERQVRLARQGEAAFKQSKERLSNKVDVMHRFYYQSIAEWVYSQQAFRELAKRYGKAHGKTAEEMEADFKEIKEEKKNDPAVKGIVERDIDNINKAIEAKLNQS
ncbi:hypothetical protein [Castellaniella sp.]|uniref:hypothetical protein n=1 Tax=Castellaniella sp. TaxID=1955812 RepID=UPI003A93A316